MTRRVYTSPRRDRVLAAVRDLWEELGHSPSESVIAERVGVSRWTVRSHLAALEQSGALRRTRGKSRTIVLLEGREAS